MKTKIKTPFRERKNDKSGKASREGQSAQIKAEEMLKQNGYIIPRETTTKEDKQGRDILIHDTEKSTKVLDHFFEKYGKTLSFDAKNAKRKIAKGKSRKNTDVSKTWTSLELQNVYGGSGWLRPGKADLIIFVTSSGEQIVADRQEILEWLVKESPVSKDIEKLHKVGWSQLEKGKDFVEHSADAEYKLYTRRYKFRNDNGSPKEDCITYVRYEDIKELKSTVILEKNS
tara:strand:+ start:398 stop:1084 length:687 start_codon:yes stop_codon:yes gene_type:complete